MNINDEIEVKTNDEIIIDAAQAKINHLKLKNIMYVKKYYKNNHDKVLAYKKAYYESHRDKMKKDALERYYKNKECLSVGDAV